MLLPFVICHMNFPKLFSPCAKNLLKTRAKANLARYDLAAVLLYFHLYLLPLILVPNKSILIEIKI